MNYIFQGIFQAMWPGIIQALQGLLGHAQTHFEQGNHDVANAALAAAAGLAQVGVAAAGGIVPGLVGVTMPVADPVVPVAPPVQPIQ